MNNKHKDDEEKKITYLYEVDVTADAKQPSSSLVIISYYMLLLLRLSPDDLSE